MFHVVAAPQDADLNEARRALALADDNQFALVTHPENQLVACTEVHNISLAHLAVALVRNRRDYASFAERVLSRKDVPWSPLMEINPAHEDEPVARTVVLH
jgi:hypothetical protein